VHFYGRRKLQQCKICRKFFNKRVFENTFGDKCMRCFDKTERDFYSNPKKFLRQQLMKRGDMCNVNIEPDDDDDDEDDSSDESDSEDEEGETDSDDEEGESDSDDEEGESDSDDEEGETDNDEGEEEEKKKKKE